MRKECKERFGCTQSGNFTHCGKYIQQNLGKHIALYHMELAQLWRCPVTWCTAWKGTAQDSPYITDSEGGEFGPLFYTMDSYENSVVGDDSAVYFRSGDRYSVVQPHRGPIVSPLSDHQSYGDSCGFPGNVYATVACLWKNRMRNRFVDIIAGVPRRWRHVCRSHRMFLLDAQSLVGQSPGPRDLASQCGGPGLLEPRTWFPYLSRKRTWTWRFLALWGWETGLVKYKRRGRYRLIRQRRRLQVAWIQVVKKTERGYRRHVLDGLSSSDDDTGGSVGLSEYPEVAQDDCLEGTRSPSVKLVDAVLQLQKDLEEFQA